MVVALMLATECASGRIIIDINRTQMVVRTRNVDSNNFLAVHVDHLHIIIGEHVNTHLVRIIG